MALITEAILEKVLDKLEALDEETITELVQSYFGKQPFLMMYIMGFNEEMNSDDAQDDLVFILLVVLECFYSLNDNIPLISTEEIDKEEEIQLETLSKFEKINDESERIEAALALMSSEQILFQFVGETLQEYEEDEETEMDEEDMGAIFGGIKLVIELMIKSFGKVGLRKV